MPQSNVAYAQQGAATQSLGSQALAATESEPAPPIPDVPLAGSTVRTDLTSPIVNDSGSYPGGPIIVGSNTGSAGTGVEGKAGAAGGYGLMGLSANTASSGKNIGVYGDGTGPGAYGVYGYSTKYIGVYGITGTGSGFGGYFANIAGGVALKASGTSGGVAGESTNGNGVQGATSFSNAGATMFQKAGVLGEDLSTSGRYDAGVAGTSTNGFGVYGTSASGTAIYGTALTGTGVYGSVTGTTGDASGVYGNDQSTAGGAGVSGSSLNNIGVLGVSDSSTAPAISGYSNGGGPTFVGGRLGGDTMSVDASGDMILAGNLTVDGTIYARSTTISSCSPSCPSPQAVIERTGEGHLIAGQGHVQLDSAFASQLDNTKAYQVFLTPDGDSQGWLYVAEKTANGFTVRESHHGASTIGFDYRIVGTPRRIELPRPIQVRMPGELRLQRQPGVR